MTKQRDVRLIIREIMDMPEYKDLSYGDILDIVYWSQFGFVHDMISNGDKTDPKSFTSVTIGHLGSFIAHPKRVDARYKHAMKEKNEKHSGELQSED